MTNNNWPSREIDSTTHIKNNVPILVEKEEKEVAHYYTDKGEYDKIRFISAKFYILNWKKNRFIRIGQIVNTNEDSKNSTFVMVNEYIFDFSKDDINKLIKK